MEVFISKFRYNSLLGSSDSLDLVVALGEAKSDAVFETKFVQSLLDEKWTAVYWVMLLEAGIYYLFLVLVTIYSTLF